MHTMSIDTAQQLVADRRTSYEGVAARRRVRKVARRAHEVANDAVPAPRATARIVAPRIAATPQPGSGTPMPRKVA